MPRQRFVRQGLPITSKIAASGREIPSALSYTTSGARLCYRGSHHGATGQFSGFIGLRCCMRSVRRRSRRTAFEQHGLGIPVFLSLSFWGGIWTIPIAWILDRLPRGWSYWIGAVCLSWCVAPDFDDLLRHLSAERSLAKRRRRLGRRRQCADRQRRLGSRICVCLVLDVCCSASDAPVGRQPRTNSNLRGVKHTRGG
jgi:hypothetical protein